MLQVENCCLRVYYVLAKSILSIFADDMNKKLKVSDPEIRKILEDYSLNSTIAGLHYAFESKQTRLGRIIWLFSIVILTTLFVYISVKNYIEWKDNPVTTTVASTGNFSK
jgi:hypothetical protein